MSKALLPVLLFMLAAPRLVTAELPVITLELDSYSITPDTITVKAGQPVTLKVVNKATFLPHNIVIKAPEAGLDIKIDLRADKSGEVTFTPTKPGTYEMVCDKAPPFGKNHKEKGMHGKLIVE